jgi:Domain of unknown function (DUF4249)
MAIWLNTLKMSFNKTLKYILVILVMGCVDPYRPPAVTKDYNLFVIDGFVNTSDGSAKVKLSRANSPSITDQGVSEQNATVTITTDAGESYLLTEQDSGKYVFTGENLSKSAAYALHVRTADGAEYISEPVYFKQAPPIDAVTWSTFDDGLSKGVNIYVSTHDPSGESTYYLWDFIETWEFLSPITSDFKWVHRRFSPRADSERIERCWRTELSSKINVASTLALNQDVIKDYQLTYIPKASNRISILYSILVRQRSIKEAEFEYYQLIHRTTESQSGLFAPLPARVLGNIRQTGSNPSPVLGYFSGGSFTEKRLYIDHYALPDDFKTPRDLMNCERDSVCFVPNLCPNDTSTLPTDASIVAPIYKGIGFIGYVKTSAYCVDCRLHGGVVKRPSFWPR